MEAVATKSGGFGGGVEWAGSRSGQIDQCVGELGGAQPTSVFKIGAQPVLVGAWLAIREVGLGCLWISDEGGVELIFA